MFTTKKWLGLTLALAVAFSTLLPFFAVYTPSIAGAGATHLSPVFGERILICTGDGFKWIKLTDLQSGKEKPKSHSDDKCPLCYAARHGLKTLAPPLATPAQEYQRTYAIVSIAYNPPLTSLYPVSPLNVRAPPLSFIS